VEARTLVDNPAPPSSPKVIEATPRPTPKPTVKSTSTPTPTPTPLPDYAAEEINISGGYGNNISFDESGNLNTLMVNVKFRNSAATEGVGDLRLHLY
jgi:hypothetical protein